MKWLIGIDEAGRGPLAGPVAVGVVLVPADFEWDQLPGVGDSKKLSPAKRESIFNATKKLEKAGKLYSSVVMESASTIDKIGIVPAINRALARALSEVMNETNIPRRSALRNVLLKLDGGLKAPPEYPHQETIIKGDTKEKVIGLASIMAKVTRDRQMEDSAEMYPQYGLEVHKGYGTKKHREAIQKHGLSIIHRKSFCQNCQYQKPDVY